MNKLLPKKKVIPADFFYYLFVFILLFNDTLRGSVIEGYQESLISDIFLLADFAVAALCLLHQKYTRTDMVLLAGILGTGVICYFAGGNTAFFLLGLTILLGKNIDLDQLLKVIFYEKTLLFIFIVLLSLLGIIEGADALNYTNSIEKGVTLGFSHANTFSGAVVYLLLLYIAINRYCLKWQHLTIVAVLEILNYRLTKTRIGLIVIFGVLFLIICCKNRNIKSIILQLAKFVLPVILLFNFMVIILRMLWDSDLLSNLDIALFNGRMGLSAFYFMTYPLTMFGSALDLSVIAKKIWYYALDNAYSIMLLYYGIVGFAIYIFVYQKTMLEMVRKKEIVLVLIIAFYMLLTVYEGYTLSASGNFMFLILGKAIGNKKNVGYMKYHMKIDL